LFSCQWQKEVSYFAAMLRKAVFQWLDHMSSC